MTRRDMLKSLIETAIDAKDADRIIEEFTQFKETSEKLAYLHGMFDVTIIDSDGDIEIDYLCVLATIVGKRWR